MKTTSGHLTYCTNIHAGETWEEHFSAIQQHFPKIKAEVAGSQAMGIGLRLSNVASLELLKKDNLNQFKDWLNSQNAYVFTMNGFPYGSFHHTVVKDQVHSPDWTTNERVDYTKRLFDILKELLPSGMDGGVSTSPLTYRHWFRDSSEALNQAKEKATRNILKIVEQLIQIKKETNQTLHLDIEPEPDGLLETGDEFIDWFQTSLIPIGAEVITQKFSVNTDEAVALLKEHVRLCYDVCHFAVGYESHQEAVDNLAQKGIKIGKFQISAALKSKMSENVEKRQDSEDEFSKYNESTYLHQVVAKKLDGSLIRYRDLPDALNDIKNFEVIEWRSHFHVPVFLENFGALQSTQSDIVEVLNIQKSNHLTPHIEVETYTWEVLPEGLKLPIEECIIRELNWVKNQLE